MADNIINGMHGPLPGTVTGHKSLAQMFNMKEAFHVFSHISPSFRMRAILSFSESGISSFGAFGCRSHVAAMCVSESANIGGSFS